MWDLTGVLPTVGELVVLWFLVSMPVYLCARRTKVPVGGLLGQSVGATVMGAVAYEGVIVGSTILYGEIIGQGETVGIVALAGAGLVWFLFFRRSLKLGWNVAIALSAFVGALFVCMSWILGDFLGLSLPALFQFPF